MKAKEYLRQLGKLEDQIRSRKRHLEALKADISYMKGMSYDSVRVQTSPSGESSALKQVERIADIEAELAREMTEYHCMRRKITLDIEKLSDLRFQEILMSRYVDRMSLQEIADEMGYSYDWIQHMHGYALLEFQKTHKEPLQKI